MFFLCHFNINPCHSLFFGRDHLPSNIGITCGPGSFAVQFGDHLRSWYHLWTRTVVPLIQNGSSYTDYVSPISSSNVLYFPNKLSKSKATGLDSISAKLMWEWAHLISIPFCNIFNKSLSSDLFPDDRKCAKLTPLFKQREQTDVDNYWPVPVISIWENITNRQSGFRSFHLTVTTLLEANDSWAFNIDRVNLNAVVFLDMKAFDTVDHDVLSPNLSLHRLQ